MFELYRPENRDSSSPHNVYSASLFCIGLGYALWHPEPHSTGEPQIGDVGFVSRGAFVRLFNINTATPEHRVTFWDERFVASEAPPSGAFRIDSRSAPIAPGKYRSRGVYERETRGSLSVSVLADAAASLSAGYTCKETQGALLALQSAAHEAAAFDSTAVTAYMLAQHSNWLEYAVGTLRHPVRAEEVVLVTGWTKTSADWAAATFSSYTKRGHASVQAQAGQVGALEFFRARTRMLSGPRVHRQGSLYPRPEGAPADELERDQCIFIRRYKIKKRIFLPTKIVAGAGPNRTLDGGDQSDGQSGIAETELAGSSDAGNNLGVFCTSSNNDGDPLDTLLDYILEISEANTALAKDEELEAIVGGNPWPTDFSTYLRHVQPPVAIQNDYGVVSIPDLLLQERVRRFEKRFISSADLASWPSIMNDKGGQVEMARAKISFDDHSNAPRVIDKWPYLAFRDKEGDNTTRNLFAVSRCGKLLAAIWDDTDAIVLWRLSDGMRVQCIQTGAASATNALAFSPSGKYLAAAVFDEVAVWDIHLAEPVVYLRGYNETVNTIQYSPDGMHIASGSHDESLKVWDATSGAPLCTFHQDGPVLKVHYSPDGSRLAAQTQSMITVYDVGPPLVQLKSLRVENESPCTFSPGGDRILVSDGRHIARVYDTTSFTSLATIDGHFKDISAAAFFTDGQRVATAAQDNFVVVRSISGERRQLRMSMEASVEAITFSPDGKFLVAIDRGGTIGAWMGRSARALAKFYGPWSKTADAAVLHFLPDSRRIVTSTGSGAICVWDVGDVYECVCAYLRRSLVMAGVRAGFNSGETASII